MRKQFDFLAGKCEGEEDLVAKGPWRHKWLKDRKTHRRELISSVGAERFIEYKQGICHFEDPQ